MGFCRIDLLRCQACAIWMLSLSFLIETVVKVEGVGSVMFLEGKSGQYLRSVSPTDNLQGNTFSKTEVSAAVAVLLGVGPPTSISQDSASELNRLLSPNPFNRPRGVLMMTVKGLETDSMRSGWKFGISSVQHRGLVMESRKPALELPAEDIRLELLNDVLSQKRDLFDLEQDLKELVFVLGGSYQTEEEPLQGTVTVPLPTATVTFHLSKKAHQIFFLELVSFFRSITRTVAVREDLEGQGPAELLMGTFRGIEALRENSDAGATTSQASQLFTYFAAKMFSYLDSAFGGCLVGVMVVPSDTEQISDMEIFEVNISSRSSRRLYEGSSIDYATVAELLTEKIIAYFTGILLIIATIMGSCCLFKMPVTRDTLLYSGVKLD